MKISPQSSQQTFVFSTIHTSYMQLFLGGKGMWMSSFKGVFIHKYGFNTLNMCVYVYRDYFKAAHSQLLSPENKFM